MRDYYVIFMGAGTKYAVHYRSTNDLNDTIDVAYNAYIKELGTEHALFEEIIEDVMDVMEVSWNFININELTVK